MKRIFLSLLLLSVLLLAGAPFSHAQDAPTINVAVLPVLDTLPLFIAKEQGYFEAEGLKVELVPVASPIERDQLIQADEAQAMVTDIPGVAFFNADEIRVQIVYTSRVAQPDAPVFRILAAPDSDLKTPADVAGYGIGVSEGTVIEYLTYRLLEGAGVDDIVTEAVPQIPVRFQLLMEGSLLAATLPDPLAQAAIGGGAIPIIDDTSLPDPTYSQSVLVFTKAFIDANPQIVTAFVKAWDRAVVDLNTNAEAFRELLLENVTVPEPLQATYQVPPFPRGLITSEEIWADYMAWMIEREIIEQAPAYEDSVNPAFLPEIEPMPIATEAAN